MKGILLTIFALVTTVLYGCIRVGAREDRLLEELERRRNEDADM